MRRFHLLSIAVLSLFSGVTQAQNIIQPTGVTFSSQNPYGVDRTAARTRDRSGLMAGSSGILGASDSTHASTATGNMWTTRGNTGSPSDTTPHIIYDLGGSTELQTIRIWNYN